MRLRGPQLNFSKYCPNSRKSEGEIEKQRIRDRIWGVAWQSDQAEGLYI